MVEDDRELAEVLGLHLESAGFQTQIAHDGESGLAWALRCRQDLVILDLGLPGRLQGLDVCRELRTRREYVPILMLTARDGEVDRVLGLELGADDYLSKPFGIREVVARVRAIFRRIDLSLEERRLRSGVIEVAGLTIDTGKRSVALDGRSLHLTPREFDLLLEFASNPGVVFTRSQLLDRVWGLGHAGYEHTVNTHINRLRAKIEADPVNPQRVLTVWGVGYKFCEVGTKS